MIEVLLTIAKKSSNPIESIVGMLSVLLIVGGLAVVKMLRDSEKDFQSKRAQEARVRISEETEKRNSALKARQEIEAKKKNDDLLARQKVIFDRARASAIETEKRQKESASEKHNLIRFESYLSLIDPVELEDLCILLFAKLGYEAKSTPASHDNGVDGFLRKDGSLTILQCKRYKGTIGEPAIRDLYGAMAHFGAKDGIIVTTGTLTNQALNWIGSKRIRVIYTKELTKLLNENISENDLTPDAFGRLKIPLPKACPKCSANLEIRFKLRKDRLSTRYLVCKNITSCNYRRRLD